jgi:hypothetical protein
LRHRCRTASLTIHLSLSGVHRDSAILEHLDGRGLQDMTNSPIYSAQLALDSYWKGIGGLRASRHEPRGGPLCACPIPARRDREARGPELHRRRAGAIVRGPRGGQHSERGALHVCAAARIAMDCATAVMQDGFGGDRSPMRDGTSSVPQASWSLVRESARLPY